MKEFDSNLISQILSIYITDVAKDISQLTDQMDGDNHEQIRRLSHKIVGASKTVGALKVSAIAEEIEEKAEKKINLSGKNLEKALFNAFNEVKEHIQKNNLIT